MKLLTIAKYSFLEAYKSKIMINTIFLGFALVLLSYVASELTFGVPERISLDFGLAALSLSAKGIAIFYGVSLLAKEIDSRTIYMMLSRPVSRNTFILGKILGMSGILFLNILILSIFTLAFFNFMGGKIGSMIIWCIIFSFFESVILLMIAVLFSLITNTVLSVIFTLVTFFVGYVVDSTVAVKFLEGKSALQGFVTFLKYTLPNFSKLNLRDFVIYEQSIDLSMLWKVNAYTFVYTMALLFLIFFIFDRKNLD